MSDNIDDVLAHFGVKGMKWGQHKKSGPTAEVTVNTSGKKIKTSGGEGLPATKEAVTTAGARQKAKKSGVRSLSNDELQAAVRRMQLETQFSQLNAQTNPSKVIKGKAAVKELLGLGKTVNEIGAFANSPAGKELRSQLKAANKK
jgi:hypothetical protein